MISQWKYLHEFLPCDCPYNSMFTVFAWVPMLRIRIRDPEQIFPGSRIPNPYFWEFSDNFFVIKFYNSLKIGRNIFLQLFINKIIFNVVKFMVTKKRMATNFFFTPPFCCSFWIWDPRSAIREKHPGSATLLSTIRYSEVAILYSTYYKR